MTEIEFIPATSPRSIGDGVFFRPIRSWHSGTYAGEGLRFQPNTKDGSGCLYEERIRGVLPICSPPKTVTHRLYWHESDPSHTISAFLSYPGGMGYCGSEYFWETYGFKNFDDIKRFFGPNSETEMEDNIRKYFSK